MVRENVVFSMVRNKIHFALASLEGFMRILRCGEIAGFELQDSTRTGHELMSMTLKCSKGANRDGVPETVLIQGPKLIEPIEIRKTLGYELLFSGSEVELRTFYGHTVVRCTPPQRYTAWY